MRQILAFKACASAFIVKANNPNEILNILMKLDLCSCCPDLVTAYSILLTLPVSVASNERRFSKLKLIKSFLRSTMAQERLSDMAI